MKDILAMHSHAHPSLQPQDAIKLCYQAAFGAEHLLSDVERARAYLYEEFSEVLSTNEPLFERISTDYVRVNLGAWKREELPVSALFEMFISSAVIRNDAENLFLSYLAIAEQIMKTEMPSFNKNEWVDFLNKYKSEGSPLIHHSEKYRENERPHYRVVSYKCFEI